MISGEIKTDFSCFVQVGFLVKVSGSEPTER